MSTDETSRAALAEARARLGDEFVVRHPHFERTLRAVRRALENYDMVVLIGPSRVGKGALIRTLVREENALVAEEPSRLRAASVRAESAYRRAFSWKRFWILSLRALSDPLPDRKVDRASPASGVARGTGAQYSSLTESQFADVFRQAAHDRGLRTLFVDEALALLKNERGRVLRDQLDLLRDLADTEPFRFVLVSTPRILEHLDLSEELDSRISEIYFPRYRREDHAEYKHFRQVVRTFMDRLPSASRCGLSPEQVLQLHQGTAGCVGHLIHWFRSAVDQCLEGGQHQLEWDHFQATFPPDAKVARRWRRCLEGEALCRRASERTFGEGQIWGGRSEPDVSSLEPDGEPAPFQLSLLPGPGRRGRRVGTPNPRRDQVG